MAKRVRFPVTPCMRRKTVSQKSSLLVAVTLAAIGLALPAGQEASAGDAPVAIVEDTSGAVKGVAPFDLLKPGRRIELDGNTSVILSYLNSCQRENIRGGSIVIGKEQSDIDGGEVARRRIPCDAAALDLTPEQANQSAIIVFRPIPPEEGVKFLIDARLPIVIAPELDEIVLEQLEHKKSRRTVKVVNGVAELAATTAPLDKGGLYRLSGGGRSLLFRVGKEATDAPLPLLQRAIRF